MTQFKVTPEELVRASGMIDVGDGGDATVPPDSVVAAAHGTPVDAAWSAFCGDAMLAAIMLDEVSIDLAAALRLAASNYTTSDVCSADGLQVRP